MRKLFFLCALCTSMAVFATEGALNGLFSVNENGKQVQFAKGNLQYQASTRTMRFAANQWDILGEANAKIAPNNADWIDLFGWGTGKEPTKATVAYTDYSVFYNWGMRPISNGGNKPNTWAVLSRNEWVHIFCNRPNAKNLLGAGTVNGVKGIILLPDNWTTPPGVTFNAGETKGLLLKGTYYKNANGNNFEHNIYSADLWKKMEAAGAVFLPAAGFRMEKDVRKAGDGGNYWTSDIALNENVDEGEAKNLDFDKGYVGMGISGRDMGFAVRLVQVAPTTARPAAVQPQEKAKGFSVAPNKKVELAKGNLQYQASTKIWRFAEHQWDVIGDNNANIAVDYAGWIDLFGWGTGNNPTNSSKDFSPTGEYAVFTDWGKNAISNGGNAANVWRTLTRDEWNYILTGRANAQNLLGSAKIGETEGHVLLPDGFVLPAGVTFDPKDATKNVYNAAAWSKMEQAGAVFMPYAGVRYGTEVFFVGEDAQYWTASSVEGKTVALIMYNNKASLSTNDRNGGMAIRLAKDIK